MSIATKFEYLGETKEKIREGINKLGGGLSTSNTFRSYADKLDEIYDSLPKVEESDVESATLEGTIKGGLDINLKGNTSQYSTTGKNLLTNTRNEKKPLNLSSGTTLTLSTKNNVLSEGGNVKFYDIDNNVVWFSINAGETSKTRQLNKDIYYVENALTGTIEYQLEIGGTPTTYEPYTGGIASPNPDYPQDIHTINGDNTIKVENKNLCYDKQVYNSTNLWLFAKSDFLEKTFTISFTSNVSLNSNSLYLKVDRVDKGLITTLTTDANNKVVKNITLTDAQYNAVKEGKEVILQIYKSGATFTIPNDAMIVNGDDTTYEPYQSNSVLLTLGDKEICKIGNYEDKIFKAIKGNEIYDSLSVEEKNTLDYGKWYLRKYIEKVVLDGSETGWGFNGSTATYHQFVRTFDGKMYGKTYYLCNKFRVDKTGIYGSAGRDNSSAISFNVKLTDCEGNTNSFKTWLSTNNLLLALVLATPTNELFNDAQQEQLEDIYNNMLSYEGQTNISQINNDKAFKIDIKAILDWRNSNSN